MSHRNGLLQPHSHTKWVLILVGALLGFSVATPCLSHVDAADDTPKSTDDRVVPFTAPPGFVVECIGPPLVEHPMFASFDERGRLYVAESSGHNLKADGLRATLPDSIRLLEDTDGDGRFDKSTVFADKLTFPQGVLWHDGAVFTASPPSLWRLEDTDGDGVADSRVELVTGFPFTGIADDLHGPSLGPDGRIYWGVGRFNYEIRRPGGPIIRQGRAPLVMRCRPDGNDAEVFSGALGNPVEMAFSDEGELFACGTFLAPSAMGPGLRDAIVHCVEGGVYPVRDRDLKEQQKRTGDLLPPLAHLGVAAASGTARSRSGTFGPDDQIDLFSALFNMHTIGRHRLEREGATFRSHNEEFLVSTAADFHPTDVLEDADGSLLVVDTGGWFRNGCPTSRIAKPEITGAIYRIKRSGVPPVSDPRGLELDWDRLSPRDLARLLDDPRFAVRDRAVERLAKHGIGALEVLEEVLRSNPSARARRNAVWVLARIEGSKASAVTRLALDDDETSVRLTSVAAVGLLRDAEALPRLAEMVNTGPPQVRREAATALGRIGRTEAVPALLDGLRAGGDRFLEHALIYALIEIGDVEVTRAALRNPSPLVRRGALTALGAMGSGVLTAALVSPLLDPAEPAVRDAALRVIAARPAWAKEMIGVLRPRLVQDLGADQRESLRNELLAFCRDPDVQDLIGAAIGNETIPVDTRVLLLETIARANLVTMPPPWTPALVRSLEDRDERVVRQAVGTIRATAVSEFDEALLRLARDPERAPELRVDALAATAPRLVRLEPELFEFLLNCLRPDNPPLMRLAAAEALGHSSLETDCLDTLTQAVAAAGALELSKLLPAYERGGDRQIGLKLVLALDRSPGLRSLTPEALHRTFKPYPADVQRAAELLLAKLDLNEREQSARLAELEPILAQGDAKQGREVFFSSKAACTTCHAVRSQGGLVGPDLTKIGAIRSGRDLLEAVVFPSASFARGYEPYAIATRDGRTYTGLIPHESADALTLVTTERIEIRIRRSEVETIEPSSISIMPQGLDTQLSRQELADLIAYLQTLK